MDRSAYEGEYRVSSQIVSFYFRRYPPSIRFFIYFISIYDRKEVVNRFFANRAYSVC